MLRTEFEAHRSSLRVPTNQRIIDQVVCQAKLCEPRYTLADVVAVIIDSGWRRFEAEWLLKRAKDSLNAAIDNASNRPRVMLREKLGR